MGLALPSSLHRTESSQESISPTTLHQAPGEQTGEGGPIFHPASLCGPVRRQPPPT